MQTFRIIGLDPGRTTPAVLACVYRVPDVSQAKHLLTIRACDEVELGYHAQVKLPPEGGETAAYRAVGDAVILAAASIAEPAGAPLVVAIEGQYLRLPKPRAVTLVDSPLQRAADKATAGKAHAVPMLARCSEHVSAVAYHVLGAETYYVPPGAMDQELTGFRQGKAGISDDAYGRFKVQAALERWPGLALPRYVRGPRKGEVKASDADHILDALGCCLYVGRRLATGEALSDSPRQARAGERHKGRGNRTLLGGRRVT